MTYPPFGGKCKTCGGHNDSTFKNCLSCRKVWRNYGRKPDSPLRRIEELEAENARLKQRIAALETK
jgi:hypothetical protein